MMWIVWMRAPQPDAPYWQGRRTLAALDAVVWPLAWVAIVATQLPQHGGLFGAVIMALLVMAACARLNTALGDNHRYRFTTWRWGCWLAKLWAFMTLVKLLLAWAH